MPEIEPTQQDSSPTRDARPRFSREVMEMMQRTAARYQFETLDDLVVTTIGTFIDRNKTGYIVELQALILELQALRQIVETLTLTNLQLAEVYQLTEAGHLDSIAAVLTELSRGKRAS
ncbi:MAG TPA: hypothetical protein VGD81_15490 [Opitutaceae bacterium]